MTTVYVNKNDCTAPKLDLPYESTEKPKFYRSKSTLIEVNVELNPKCFQEDYRRRIVKKWFMWKAGITRQTLSSNHSVHYIKWSVCESLKGST